MPTLNLFSTKVTYFASNNKIKITSIDISFSEVVSPPTIDDITVQLFDNTTLTFKDYVEGTEKLYFVTDSTTKSCGLCFKPNKELNSLDIINIILKKPLKNELTDSYDLICISLFDLFNAVGSIINPIHYELPSTPGDYQIQLTQINETNITSQNIKSSIINIRYPIKSADIHTHDITTEKTCTSMSLQINNARDEKCNLSSADFITVIKIKVE